MNTLSIVLIIAATLTVVATVLLYIFVLPEKKRDSLPKIGKIMHDILHFKSLFIEKMVLNLSLIQKSRNEIIVG